MTARQRTGRTTNDGFPGHGHTGNGAGGVRSGSTLAGLMVQWRRVRWRRVMSLASALVVTGALAAGCAAGHIERFSQPADDVTIGLAPDQVELRVQADAARRTPWQGGPEDESGLSMGALFDILVDGMPSAESPSSDPAATMAQAGGLSEEARRYLTVLKADFEAPADQAAAVKRHLTARTTVTRQFISAASHVAAGLRLKHLDFTADESVREDLRLIAETLSRLKAQRATFGEVASILAVNDATAQDLPQALDRLDQAISALELLTRSMGSDRLS